MRTYVSVALLMFALVAHGAVVTIRENTGIGTENPLQKFVVSNSGAEGMEIFPSGGNLFLQGYNRSTFAYAPVFLSGTTLGFQIAGTTKMNIAAGGNVELVSNLVFEGATADGFETTLTVTDPTANRTVTFQNASGTVAYLTDITGGTFWFTNSTAANSISNAYNVSVSNFTGTGTLTFPTINITTLNATTINGNGAGLTNLAGNVVIAGSGVTVVTNTIAGTGQKSFTVAAAAGDSVWVPIPDNTNGYQLVSPVETNLLVALQWMGPVTGYPNTLRWNTGDETMDLQIEDAGGRLICGPFVMEVDSLNVQAPMTVGGTITMNGGDTTRKILNLEDPTSPTDSANKSYVDNAHTNFTVYAAGTAYSLTATPALLNFGTTDPSVTIDQAGTYLIHANAGVKYNAATYVAAQTATIKLRRTNNTAADLTNGGRTVTLPVLTTFTGGDTFTLPPIIYTATAGDIIQIFGSVSATPSAGSVDTDSAEIVMVRLY